MISKLKKLSGIIFLAIITAVIVVIVLTLTNRPVVNEEYFTNDDTKTTISLTPNTSESNNTALVQTHFVYTYDGDDVSGLKTYFEYSDEESARTTLESIKNQPEFKGATIEGKYIVVSADESQYKGLTKLDIKQQADALKSLQDTQKSEE